MFKLLAIFFEPLFRLIAGGAAVYLLYDLMSNVIMPLFDQLSTRAITDATSTGGWAAQLPVVAQFFEFFEVSRHVSLLVACIMAGAALKFATASMKAFVNSLQGVGTGVGGR